MPDQSLSQKQQVDDLTHAPAAAPATAAIVPDTPEPAPSPDQPEINPGPPPETNPDLQPEIPPVENPSIQRPPV